MIKLPLGDLVVTLPEPEQVVGSHDEVSTGQGRLVTRRPVVSVRSNVATLAFEAVAGGPAVNGSFGEANTTTARMLPEISTIQLAKNHFFGERSAKVGKAFKENSDSVTTKEFPDLVVVKFNFAAAGWEPGNSVEYAVLRDRSGAVLFDPTHYMDFDWSRLQIEPGR